MRSLLSLVQSSLPRRGEWLAWGLLFAAFLSTAQLGFYLLSHVTAEVLIWPPIGIAIAGMLLGGYRMWSAIALASLLANLLNGTPLFVAIVSMLGNVAQPLLATYLFKRYDFYPVISGLRDTLLLIAAAVVLTSIVPTAVTAALLVAGAPIDPVSLWRIMWSGGILSALVFTPLITTWYLDKTPWSVGTMERLAALTALTSVSYVIFWTGTTNLAGIPLVYVLLAPLFWIGVRFRPRSIVLALFLLASIAISGTVFNDPGTGVPLSTRLFNLQLFLEIIAIIYLILSSVVEERRRATEELGARVSQLQHALERIRGEDKAKSQFLAILAHELRNPLAPVLHTLELFRLRHATSAEELELLLGAEQRLHMMSRLLDDLLDVARISEKRLRLQKQTVQINGLVPHAVEMVRPLVAKYGHDLSVSLPQEELWVYADPVRLEQIIVNLLNNSAKYTPQGGRIAFQASRSRDTVVLTVTDNGTGIPNDMLERIFEPFLQIPSTKGTSGVGIGLSLTKQLVEMHGGEVKAESQGLGHGSRFTVKLPIVDAPQQKPVRERLEQPDRAPSAGLCILIVDDNEAAAESLGRLLTFRGHTTKLAFRGIEAIQIADAMQPDVILLDIGLPDMDGYEVARQLRARGSSALLAALTGYGQQDDKEKAALAGFDHHLTKPVGLADIEKILPSKA